MTKYDDVCADLVNSPRRWLVTGVAGFIGSALLGGQRNATATSATSGEGAQ
jgi:hypothetical protein